MGYGDMFSKKRLGVNRGEARQLQQLEDESGPRAQSPIKGRKGPETSEEYKMRRTRRGRKPAAQRDIDGR